MAKQRIFDLPQTKGEFQIRGNVSGTAKQGFFASKKTKNNSDMNIANFGVVYDAGQTAYLTLSGTVNKSVYYYSGTEKNTKEVAWAQRDKCPANGYNLIGVKVGLETETDENGKVSNIKKTLVDYDAAEYISKHLQDNSPVFVKGNLEFSSYVDKKGETKRGHKLIPNQISLCAKPIDFEDEEYKTLADFKTTIVFESIEKEKDDQGKETGRFVLNALSIGYSTITNVSFIIEDAKLAQLMKKNLKAYNAIEVGGVFKSTIVVESVTEEDDWGQKNSFDRVNVPRKFEMVITGAKPATIDRETYTEENIASARKAIANKEQTAEKFGDKKATVAADDGWGSTPADTDMEEEW